jgi:hypothetical protein
VINDPGVVATAEKVLKAAFVGRISNQRPIDGTIVKRGA